MRARRATAGGALAVVAVALSGCGAQDGANAAGTAVASASVSAAAVNTSVGARAGLPCPTSTPDAAAVPDGLPDLTLACLGPGPDVTLSGLRGTPVVLNVWASWCVPCRTEMPMLAELATDAGDALEVLGVDVQDDRQAGTDFAAAAGIASVYDPDGATRAALGWPGPPVTYLVAADGRIVHRIVGQIADAATLRQAVAQHLGVEVRDA